MTELVTLEASKTPALITAASDRAACRFLEYFTAQFRNPHTRRAYVRAIGAFCA
jgi:integrase/recombinase XerD